MFAIPVLVLTIDFMMFSALTLKFAIGTFVKRYLKRRKSLLC